MYSTENDTRNLKQKEDSRISRNGRPEKSMRLWTSVARTVSFEEGETVMTVNGSARIIITTNVIAFASRCPELTRVLPGFLSRGVYPMLT